MDLSEDMVNWYTETYHTKQKEIDDEQREQEMQGALHRNF